MELFLKLLRISVHIIVKKAKKVKSRERLYFVFDVFISYLTRTHYMR